MSIKLLRLLPSYQPALPGWHVLKTRYTVLLSGLPKRVHIHAAPRPGFEDEDENDDEDEWES
jgi:hypothetical protein